MTAEIKPERVLYTSFPLCFNRLGWFLQGREHAHFFICARHPNQRIWFKEEGYNIIAICPVCESELTLDDEDVRA